MSIRCCRHDLFALGQRISQDSEIGHLYLLFFEKQGVQTYKYFWCVLLANKMLRVIILLYTDMMIKHCKDFLHVGVCRLAGGAGHWLNTYCFGNDSHGLRKLMCE